MNPSACVVLVRDDKIAAIRSRKHDGALELPGGKAEPGETAWENAARECYEEIGLLPRCIRLLLRSECGGFDCSCFLVESDDELVSGPEGEAVWVTPAELLTGTYASHTAQWLPLVERVQRGFYRHYASNDPYFVTGVAIRDEYGHGNVDAPRDVIYESTRSLRTGLPNSRTEAEFTALVMWPDGVMRPRFIRWES